MRFTTRMTLLFALVLGAFVVSTLPMTAGLLRGVLGNPARQADWDKVAAQWANLDPATREKTAALMGAITEWKAASAAPSLEGDARYLRFQTAFLMFATIQALVLLVLVALGLRWLMAPVRNMAKVVARLKNGDPAARLEGGGGAEWRALAHQFNTMLDQNQTLNRLQGWQEVAAFLSHQIKNPLTSIAFAEQNVRHLVPDLPPLAAENLAIIGDQGRRINHLVKRLRDLTSFDQMARVEVDLRDWFVDWVAGRRREGEVWQVALDDVGRASLVPLLWEQAFDNLLANSREASGGPSVSVTLTVRREGALVAVDWSDGNRLAEGVRVDLVGTARFTTKKDGSGLGVFFIRRIAELHGGTLAVSQSSGGGLRFVLTLEGGGHGPDPRRR
jgi:signal transduction histidine kinase